MKVLGVIAVLLCIGVLIRLYHGFMSELYREEMRQELEKRFAKEIGFRWQNQDVKIRR